MRTPRFLARSFALLAAGLAASVGFAAGSRTSLRIEQTVEPRFPPALAHSVIMQGTVTVMIQVDDAGTLQDWLILSYSHPAFAQEVADVIPRWRYRIDKVGGEAVVVRCRLEITFTASGRVITLTPESTLEALRGSFEFDSVRLTSLSRELDAPLQVLSAPAPRHPGLPEKSDPESGLVTLDFFVDAEGQPRLPAVLLASHGAYADAALAALKEWRFTVPTRRGKPTTTHVRQQFVFDQKPSA